MIHGVPPGTGYSLVDLAAIYNPIQRQGALKRMCSVVCLTSFFFLFGLVLLIIVALL